MNSIQKTRFVAANYSNLQGLKAVPIALLLIIIVVWANGQTGRASDLSLPLVIAAGGAALTWMIHRYYRTHFGRVEKTFQQRRFELALGIAGALVALAAFIADTAFELPVSLTGLVFAAAAAAEYLRMQWYAPGKYLLPLTLASVSIAVLVSILPLLGAEDWYRLLGMRAQIFGVLIVTGVVGVINGLLGHLFFLRQLPAGEE